VRRAAKRDANHAALVAGLRAAGVAVTDLGHVGQGIPDLFVSARLCCTFVEVKAPGGGKKRGAAQAASLARQEAFRELHEGWVVVASTVNEVLAALGLPIDPDPKV
jgi:hypothetical protein